MTSDSTPDDAQEAPTPAARIIARFGVKRLAEWSGRSTSRVYAWKWSRAKGGTGGAVPLACRPAIISGARQDLGQIVSHAEFEPIEGEIYLDIAESVA